mmetsp:Transcript_12005/g.33946  ORF Transcript_12005/g.33946 Transcript_12005/m.33946 type:complete len:204 (-) Transcript_12005:596-1207(-)
MAPTVMFALPSSRTVKRSLRLSTSTNDSQLMRSLAQMFLISAPSMPPYEPLPPSGLYSGGKFPAHVAMVMLKVSDPLMPANSSPKLAGSPTDPSLPLELLNLEMASTCVATSSSAGAIPGLTIWVSSNFKISDSVPDWYSEETPAWSEETRAGSASLDTKMVPGRSKYGGRSTRTSPSGMKAQVGHPARAMQFPSLISSTASL